MANKGYGTRLSLKARQEIVDTYNTQPDLRVREIAETYGTSEGTVYRILQQNNVPLRGNGKSNPAAELHAQLLEERESPLQKFNKAVEAELKDTVGTLHLYPGRKAAWVAPSLAVTVDAQDTVQAVIEGPKVKQDAWVVRFTAEVTVEAESIDLALAAVRKLGTAKRIYSVRLKSGNQ